MAKKIEGRLVTAEDPTLLLVNPRARRGEEAFKEVAHRLGDAVHLVDAVLPEGIEAFRQQIRAGLDRGVRRFVIGGGDGTICHAAEVLLGTPGVLAVLPLGTGNTFAAGLGLPRSWAELIRVIREGEVAQCDVGVAETKSRRQVFLNSVTIGVSETLVNLLTPAAKKRLGWMAWLVLVRRAVRETPAITVRLRLNGLHDAFVTRQLIIGNGRTMAGPILTAPHASNQDGLLDVFCFGGPSTISMIRLLALLPFGRHVEHPQAHYHMTDSLEIETEPAVLTDVDGEVWEATPIRCRVLPAALQVIKPHTREGEHGIFKPAAFGAWFEPGS